MGRTEQPKSTSLNFEGNNIFVWLLQSSVIVAMVAAILYAFGANYDYRLRWEFGLQNVQLTRPTSDLTYDGLIVVSAWFKTFQPYILFFCGSLISVAFHFAPIPKFFARTRTAAKIVIAISFVALSGFLVNGFLRTRAALIADVISERAANAPQSLLFSDESTLEGYVISSSDERTAFLTKSGAVRIVASKDITTIIVPAR